MRTYIQAYLIDGKGVTHEGGFYADAVSTLCELCPAGEVKETRLADNTLVVLDNQKTLLELNDGRSAVLVDRPCAEVQKMLAEAVKDESGSVDWRDVTDPHKARGAKQLPPPKTEMPSVLSNDTSLLHQQAMAAMAKVQDDLNRQAQKDVLRQLGHKDPPPPQGPKRSSML